MKKYICDCCGCTLDPGEGRMCDECLEEQDKKQQRKQLLGQMIKSTNYKQMNVEDFLNEHN